MAEVRHLTVGAEEARERLDHVLKRHVTDLSRSRLKALIEAGCVSVAGATMTDAASRVNEGATIALTLPDPVPAEPEPEPIPLTVVHEDEHLIVIDKPAGLVVHPAAGNWTGTLVNALIAHCGASLSGIGGVRRPGIVHRLDKDTTGLMVAAKTDLAHQGLAAQFADHGRSGPLERAYRAFAWGAPARDRLTIDLPLDRDTKNRERRAVRPGGDEAITHVTVERRLADGLVSDLTCRLETGRTHQIRAHLAHLGHPLLGDELYGRGFRTKAARLDEATREALDRLGRQALHAAVLGFEHPATGRTLRFQSPLPPDMAMLSKGLSRL